METEVNLILASHVSIHFKSASNVPCQSEHIYNCILANKLHEWKKKYNADVYNYVLDRCIRTHWCIVLLADIRTYMCTTAYVQLQQDVGITRKRGPDKFIHLAMLHNRLCNEPFLAVCRKHIAGFFALPFRCCEEMAAAALCPFLPTNCSLPDPLGVKRYSTCVCLEVASGGVFLK